MESKRKNAYFYEVNTIKKKVEQIKIKPNNEREVKTLGGGEILLANAYAYSESTKILTPKNSF